MSEKVAGKKRLTEDAEVGEEVRDAAPVQAAQSPLAGSADLQPSFSAPLNDPGNRTHGDRTGRNYV
jgi:hypothetical protein